MTEEKGLPSDGITIQKTDLGQPFNMLECLEKGEYVIEVSRDLGAIIKCGRMRNDAGGQSVAIEINIDWWALKRAILIRERIAGEITEPEFLDSITIKPISVIPYSIEFEEAPAYV